MVKSGIYVTHKFVKFGGQIKENLISLFQVSFGVVYRHNPPSSPLSVLAPVPDTRYKISETSHITTVNSMSLWAMLIILSFWHLNTNYINTINLQIQK